MVGSSYIPEEAQKSGLRSDLRSGLRSDLRIGSYDISQVSFEVSPAVIAPPGGGGTIVTSPTVRAQFLDVSRVRQIGIQ